MIINYPRQFPNFYVHSELFTDNECKSISKYMHLFKTKDAIVQNQNNNERRKSKICFHTYKKDATDWIFHRLNTSIDLNNKKLWNFDLERYSSIQYTEYDDTNSHYDWHTDLLGELDGVRKLTISVLLDDDFIGGDFKCDFLCRESSVIPLKKGDAIIFPSFMPHKVDKVTSGCRKSLVAWVLGPDFK